MVYLFRGSLHTSHLLMYPSLWLLVPGLSSHFCHCFLYNQLLRSTLVSNIFGEKWLQDSVSFGNPCLLYINLSVAAALSAGVLMPQWSSNSVLNNSPMSLTSSPTSNSLKMAGPSLSTGCTPSWRNWTWRSRGSWMRRGQTTPNWPNTRRVCSQNWRSSEAWTGHTGSSCWRYGHTSLLWLGWVEQIFISY